MDPRAKDREAFTGQRKGKGLCWSAHRLSQHHTTLAHHLAGFTLPPEGPALHAGDVDMVACCWWGWPSPILPPCLPHGR